MRKRKKVNEWMNEDKKRECARRDESEIEIDWKSCREDDDDV